LAPLGSKRRVALSWLVVVLGFLLGLFVFAYFGMEWLDLSDRSSGWFLGWTEAAGIGLLGLGLIAGSIVAPRNRRRAGLIFLIFMPIAAFCLAYQDAGFMVWEPDGSLVFETPTPPTAIGLTLLFFAPLWALLLPIRHRKRAAYLFAISACVAGIALSVSHWSRVLVLRLTGWSAPFALPGIFWWGTDKLGWPPPIAPRTRPLARQVGAIVLSCLTVLSLDVILTLTLAAFSSSLSGPDCSGRRLFARPVFPGHTVFTARVIFASISAEDFARESIFRIRGGGPGELRDPRVGDWAIGVVREKFWGLPRWAPRVVLLTNHIFWQGETYFVDGNRERGLLTRFLPVVEAGPCARTSSIKDAIVDLRVLREPPSATGTRLIGFVRQPERSPAKSIIVAPPAAPSPSAGARIRVTGPSGTRIIVTDQSGVYQLDDLPPGLYNLELLLPDTQIVSAFPRELLPVQVKGGDLVERNFDIAWNGRIEGRIQDDSGKPAHVWVVLRGADGSQVQGRGRYFLLNRIDGSYQIKEIPPGRYVLMVNPDGPDDKSPYGIQYYPSALRAKDAAVRKLAEGQKIPNVDFTVPRLNERTVQVRVTWPNGSPAADSPVYASYEHTHDYESLAGASGFTRTGQDGVADVHLYRSSRVRLYAQQVVWSGDNQTLREFYSHSVESEIGKMPDKINLVLTSEKP